MERIGLSSATTSMAQTSTGQNEFLFKTPNFEAEEPETPSFSQTMSRWKFPHASIPFDYTTGPKFSKSLSYEEDVEEGREINHSQSWSTPPELTHPEVTSQVVPPTSTTSYPAEEETNEVRQFLARQHPSYKSPQTSTIQGSHFPNYHHSPFTTPTYTHDIPPNPTVNFPQYHTTPTYPSIHQTLPYTTNYFPQYPGIYQWMRHIGHYGPKKG